jgi:hypothetical protein
MRTNNEELPLNITPEVASGATVYTNTLKTYDPFVLGYSNRFLWRCPTRIMLDFYNEHVSNRHMDVGVGTGYYLDRCSFPSTNPTIALVDLNPVCLQYAANRIRRYDPKTYVVNILEPFQVDSSGFDSIGINYLLHCLPGNILSKAVVFRNLKPFLSKDGVIFGSTILGQGVKSNILARMQMRLYNSRGIFCNDNDSQSDLEKALKENFVDYSLRIVGCVALFTGRI